MHKAHRDFVESELRKLIPPGSFASYIVENLGAELRSTIDMMAAEEHDEYMPSFTDSLYRLLKEGWSLDVDWFQWTDGAYRDDEENEIPQSVQRRYTACEQMAACGLSILADDQLSLFDLDALQDTQALDVEHLKDWRYEVLLDAYKSLVFAQRLRQDETPGLEGISGKRLVDFSALGAAGAKKRHAPQAELRKWAIERFRSGKWPSANAAAFDLANEIVEQSRKIGAHLSPANAQRTIAEWFRKSG